MNIKQILVSAGIAAGFLIITFGAILLLDSAKSKNDPEGSDQTGVTEDMSDMHAPPEPADETLFASLLGKPAPEFSLKSYDGKTIELASFKGKNVLLFFSEGAMCYPSCWEQIDSLAKDKGFTQTNTTVLNIVVDSKTEWDGVVKQYPKLAGATVLLDSDRTVSTSYGVLTVESSMHRGQFPGHTYLIIDKEGTVRFQKDDPNMGLNNESLLAYLSKLE
jgi:peroxiredoxin